MPARPRDYRRMPPDQRVSVEFSISAVTAARVLELLERAGSRVLPGGRGQVIDELVDGFLDIYERQIVRPRVR